MTADVLTRIADKIRPDYPAEALHLHMAAKEMRRMEKALDEIVREHRAKTQVVKLKTRMERR